MKSKTRSCYDDFSIMTNFENLYKAHYSCKKGKMWKDSVIQYHMRALECTGFLQMQIGRGTYKISPYHCFEINERGKIRKIMSVKYKDRIVQKCFNDNIFVPYIESKFAYENAASQKGKGTDFSRELLKKHMREMVSKYGADCYVLVCDIHNYFGSISHEKINAKYRKYFTDERLLKMVDDIHSSTPGDAGVPIGNQLSQGDALLMLNAFDHMIKEKLHVRQYGRYMDDFYLLSNSKDDLYQKLDIIRQEIKDLGLELNEKKTKIASFHTGFIFLGFHYFVTDSGKVIMLLDGKKKRREKRRIRKHKKKVESGEMTFKDAKESYRSWRSHVEGKNTYYLLQEMDLFFMNTFIKFLNSEELKQLNVLIHKSNIRKEKRKNKRGGKRCQKR